MPTYGANEIRTFSKKNFYLILVRDIQKEKQWYAAAKAGNLEKVKGLLKNTFVDGDDNEYGQTPLMVAGKNFLYIWCKETLIYYLTQ